jgi:ferric-dicitrate binding protein FerR (iron transport regulator)
VLCGYAAVAGDLGVAAVLGAAFAVLLSLAQRVLSSHVRLVRRSATAVRGEIELADGTRSEMDAASLMAPAERALRLLTFATIALAAALVAFRV